MWIKAFEKLSLFSSVLLFPICHWYLETEKWFSLQNFTKVHRLLLKPIAIFQTPVRFWLIIFYQGSVNSKHLHTVGCCQLGLCGYQWFIHHHFNWVHPTGCLSSTSLSFHLSRHDNLLQRARSSHKTYAIIRVWSFCFKLEVWICSIFYLFVFFISNTNVQKYQYLLL